MNKIKFIAIICVGILYSCKDQDNNRNTSKYDLKLKINSINISTDSLAKYQYEVFTFKDNENLQLISYNNTSHSIEFFDLNEKILKKRIFLESDGSKAIADVQGIYYHNQDSIFIYTRGVITIINESYSKEANPNLFTSIKNYNLKYEPKLNHHFRLYYIPEIKSIPLFNIYYDAKFQISEKAEQISLFDLSNFEIETLPYFQTEPIESDIEYGFLNYTTISQPFDGEFLVNQVYSPKTYQFNSDTNNFMQVIGANKIHHKPNRNPDDWVSHAVESNFYNQLEK